MAGGGVYNVECLRRRAWWLEWPDGRAPMFMCLEGRPASFGDRSAAADLSYKIQRLQDPLTSRVFSRPRTFYYRHFHDLEWPFQFRTPFSVEFNNTIGYRRPVFIVL